MSRRRLRFTIPIVLLVVVAWVIGVTARQVWLARQAEHPMLISQKVRRNEQAVGSLFGANVWKWTTNTNLPQGTLKLWAEYYLHGEHQGTVTEVRNLSLRGVPRGTLFYLGWDPDRERHQLSFQVDETIACLDLQVEGGSMSVLGGCSEVSIVPGEASILAIFVYGDEQVTRWPEGTVARDPDIWRDYVLKNDRVYAVKIQLDVREGK